MSALILLTCATCKVDAEAADTRLHEDEVECGTCRSRRHRREALAYAATEAKEDAAADARAEKRITRHQQRVGAMQPGGFLRAQAGS